MIPALINIAIDCQISNEAQRPPADRRATPLGRVERPQLDRTQQLQKGTPFSNSWLHRFTRHWCPRRTVTVR